MRTSLAWARPILYFLVTILARDSAAPLRVKLNTMHDTNRSHARSGGLLKSLKAVAKPLAS